MENFSFRNLNLLTIKQSCDVFCLYFVSDYLKTILQTRLVRQLKSMLAEMFHFFWIQAVWDLKGYLKDNTKVVRTKDTLIISWSSFIYSWWMFCTKMKNKYVSKMCAFIPNLGLLTSLSQLRWSFFGILNASKMLISLFYIDWPSINTFQFLVYSC
jgi:hypothetical protein